MDIDKQVKLQNDINIIPLNLRFLRNFIRFLNTNLTNLSTKFLMAYILVLKKICHFVFILLNFLILIQSRANSLSNISIKILNLFLFNYITKNEILKFIKIL